MTDATTLAEQAGTPTLTCPDCLVHIGPRGWWNPYDRLAWHGTHAHGWRTPA